MANSSNRPASPDPSASKLSNSKLGSSESAVPPHLTHQSDGSGPSDGSTQGSATSEGSPQAPVDMSFNSSPVKRTSPTRIGAADKAVSKTARKNGSTNAKAQTTRQPTRAGSSRTRVPLFFAVGIGLSLAAAGLKAIAAALSEIYLYSLPWVGGFLRSIETAEISNWMVFALLSVSMGAATIWLPRHWNRWAKAGLLIVVSPFVFSASYLVQQRMWVQRVAERSDISYPEAQQITDAFLERETGRSGFWGFYPYTTEVADLPTSRASLEKEAAKNASQLLTNELASYNDSRADLVAYIFERVGWLLRLMYMAIAAVTALIYYDKGREWAERKRLAVQDSSVKNSSAKN